MPRYVALALAGLVIGVGVWLAASTRGSGREGATPRSLTRREALLRRVEQLERAPPQRSISPERYSGAAAASCVAELEQIYGPSWTTWTRGPQGGGEGVAA